MDISDIKTEMLKYRDIFGGELLDVDKVVNSTSKEELASIIDSHYDHLEMMARDGQSSLERFKQKLGLNII